MRNGSTPATPAPRLRDHPRQLDPRVGAAADPPTDIGLPVMRQRPERFIVTERPQREHGERYQHVPGTPDVRGEVGALIDSLHTLFERDRAVASQPGAARCGICYLYHPASALVYREIEGCYVCPGCAKALGSTRILMVRRQQRT